MRFTLTWGDRGCFSSLLFLPKVILGDNSASTSGAESSGAGGSGGFIEGVGGISLGIGGTDGTSIPCGDEAMNGLIRENASDSLFESLRSTGDLTAVVFVGEKIALSKEIGDEGAEDTGLIILSCGKTVIPHLLTERMGAGVNRGCVSGEVGSDG